MISKNVQCGSLAVGHKKRHDETAFHKRYYDSLPVHYAIEDVMRLPSTKCVMSLTDCW